MHFERIAACFRDILQAVSLIETWVDEAGGPDGDILGNMKLRSAIERQLLIVSEAATRMHKLNPGVAFAFAPDIDWPGIRGIGNFIRHKYDDLDASIIEDVIRNRLSALSEACRGALQE